MGLLDDDEIMTRTFGSVTYFCIKVGFQLKFTVAILRFKTISFTSMSALPGPQSTGLNIMSTLFQVSCLNFIIFEVLKLSRMSVHWMNFDASSVSLSLNLKILMDVA